MEKYATFTVIVLGVVAAGLVLWGSGVFGTNIQNTAIIKNTMNQELFIDVRTDQEWNAGHVDGAVHFDLARLRQGELPDTAKDLPIAAYCRTGIRAGEALKILQENGFSDVRNAGGLGDLQTQGKKICTGTQSSCG